MTTCFDVYTLKGIRVPYWYCCSACCGCLVVLTVVQVNQVDLGVLQGYFYYIFGFCFVVGALTVIITIEVAIVTTYVQLCAEDYQWW